ncbi:DUF3570 domain-containing protein [Wenyingzhuangia sp. IMCC45533]
MRKKVLYASILSFWYFSGFGQKEKKNVYQTDIETVYRQYNQNGNNSAITGGIGTEKLDVYGLQTTLNQTVYSHTLTVQIGTDIISSASTDNIDDIKSSASILDPRYYGGITLLKKYKNNLSVYAGGGFSLESDYYSDNYKLGFKKINPNYQYAASFQFFNDDLRWGRGNSQVGRKPVRLIYPSELRFREWYDTYKRQSFNLNLGYQQVINQKAIGGIYPAITYQKGLLETPFHRIFFTDGSGAVEQLPETRLKLALAVKINYFLLGKYILKNTLNNYTDSFGITAFSLENETSIKLKRNLILLPNVRFYTQTKADAYKGFGEHLTSDKYYTSDPDLSDYNTYAIGIGLKFKPINLNNKKRGFNNYILRYRFYHRDNNLNGHMISFVINYSNHLLDSTH